ncbi:hypothetical protein N8827_01140 [Pelagibacteraceae bacterium]|nr:hypothetical protein [Pelagibacteraceae bacterium]
MKLIFLFPLIFILTNCSKPKTVLICGDHVCINKAEANQYFEENLTIEVKILDKKEKKKIDLIELNLKEDQKGKRKISVTSKSITNEELKTLSNKEIVKIKENIKNKKKEKKQVEKLIKKNEEINDQVTSEAIIDEKKMVKKIIKKNGESNKSIKNEVIIKENKIDLKTNKPIKKNVIKKSEDVVDVCTILEKCSIEEISKYILKQSKEKNYPDITTRQ